MIAEEKTAVQGELGLESIHLMDEESGRVLRLVSGLSVKEKDRILRKSKRLGDVGNRVLAFYLFDLEERGEAQLLGFPSAVDYARKKLDLPRRTARELIEVGSALCGLRRIDEAFALGEISWSRVRLLASVATPETEEAWLSAAKELSWVELELQAKLAKKGEMPRRDRKGLPEVRLKVPIVLNPLMHEFWMQAKRRLSAERGDPFTDSEAFVELVRRYWEASSGGSQGEGEGQNASSSFFRVSVQWCPSCEVPEVVTEDGPIPIDARSVAPFLQDAEVTTEKESTGQGSSTVAVHKDRTTPAWMRDLVLARDGFRCLHCQSREELMVHHVVWRSRGGRTDPSNLATCCTPCHVLIHAECLVVSGEAPHGLAWTSKAGETTTRPLADEATLRLRIPDSDASMGMAEHSTATINALRPSLRQLPTEIDSGDLENLVGALAFCDRRGAFHYDEEAPIARPQRDSSEHETLGGRVGPSHRPEGLDEILGQRRTVTVLKQAVLAAQRSGEAMAHTLLLGGPGLGKSSLMGAAARELSTKAHLTSGPHLRDLGVLLQLLLRLRPRDILGIDEIHALPPRVAEALYEAMEDGVLTLPVTDGTQARTLRFRLPPFTVIGATTETAALPKPLVMRFALRELLEWYETDDLAEIVTRASRRTGLSVAPEAARVLARAGRDTPREALALFTRLRISAIAAGITEVDAVFARGTLAAHGIDPDGLGPMDRRLLELLQSHREPIGLERLATLLGTTAEILRDVHEPFLLRRGLLQITPHGRTTHHGKKRDHAPTTPLDEDRAVRVRG